MAECLRYLFQYRSTFNISTDDVTKHLSQAKWFPCIGRGIKTVCLKFAWFYKWAILWNAFKKNVSVRALRLYRCVWCNAFLLGWFDGREEKKKSGIKSQEKHIYACVSRSLKGEKRIWIKWIMCLQTCNLSLSVHKSLLLQHPAVNWTNPALCAGSGVCLLLGEYTFIEFVHKWQDYST